jgi:hypothetical protein
VDGLPHSLNEVKVLLAWVRKKVAFKDPACTFIVTCNRDMALCDVVEGTDTGDHDGNSIQPGKFTSERVTIRERTWNNVNSSDAV